MKSVNFKVLFISLALLFVVSSCNSLTNESVMPIGTSEKTANETDIELDDNNNEHRDTTSNIYPITNHNDVSELSDMPISSMQGDIPKEYLALDDSSLVIPSENEWKSVGVWDASGEEFDANAASGVYNDGITYFLNGESYIRFPTGYTRCVSKEKASDIDLLEMGQFETTWEKVSVGDTIGTLKVERAYTVYSYIEQLDVFLWNDIEVLFSGETVLDGYLKKYSPVDVMYPNEIHFIPDTNSLNENEFPMLCNSRTKEGTMNCFKLYFKDHCIYGDTTEISINSLSDSVFEELSEILDNEGICKARVTLSNIKLRAWVENVDNNRYCSADLINCDIII